MGNSQSQSKLDNIPKPSCNRRYSSHAEIETLFKSELKSIIQKELSINNENPIDTIHNICAQISKPEFKDAIINKCSFSTILLPQPQTDQNNQHEEPVQVNQPAEAVNVNQTEELVEQVNQPVQLEELNQPEPLVQVQQVNQPDQLIEQVNQPDQLEEFNQPEPLEHVNQPVQYEQVEQVY